MRLATLGLGVSVLGGLLVALVLLADIEPSQEETVARVAELIRRLGDQEFARREAATKELAAVGEPALPPLREAVLGSEDPEIRHRARGIIRTILWAARTSKSTGLEMVPVSSGEFVMGSPGNEYNRRPDEAQHRVRITRSFLLGVYEVTQRQYEKVTGANPSWYAEKGGGKDRVAGLDTATFPVESVTWFDAVEFCNLLSKKDRYPPYYELADVKREGGAITAATVKVLGGNGYRLPTEAEWEYACRAGTTRAFHFGGGGTGREANLKPSPDAGGYGGPPQWKPVGRPTTVGGYKPNAFGLYDMHGNVGEWCWDWYEKDYHADAPQDDPAGPLNGSHKLSRGGSWMVPEGSGRSATRFTLAPGERKDFAGFRVARTP